MGGSNDVERRARKITLYIHICGKMRTQIGKISANSLENKCT